MTSYPAGLSVMDDGSYELESKWATWCKTGSVNYVECEQLLKLAIQQPDVANSLYVELYRESDVNNSANVTETVWKLFSLASAVFLPREGGHHRLKDHFQQWLNAQDPPGNVRKLVETTARNFDRTLQTGGRKQGPTADEVKAFIEGRRLTAVAITLQGQQLQFLFQINTQVSECVKYLGVFSSSEEAQQFTLCPTLLPLSDVNPASIQRVALEGRPLSPSAFVADYMRPDGLRNGRYSLALLLRQYVFTNSPKPGSAPAVSLSCLQLGRDLSAGLYPQGGNTRAVQAALDAGSGVEALQLAARWPYGACIMLQAEMVAEPTGRVPRSLILGVNTRGLHLFTPSASPNGCAHIGSIAARDVCDVQPTPGSDQEVVVEVAGGEFLRLRVADSASFLIMWRATISMRTHQDQLPADCPLLLPQPEANDVTDAPPGIAPTLRRLDSRNNTKLNVNSLRKINTDVPTFQTDDSRRGHPADILSPGRSLSKELGRTGKDRAGKDDTEKKRKKDKLRTADHTLSSDSNALDAILSPRQVRAAAGSSHRNSPPEDPNVARAASAMLKRAGLVLHSGQTGGLTSTLSGPLDGISDSGSFARGKDKLEKSKSGKEPSAKGGKSKDADRTKEGAAAVAAAAALRATGGGRAPLFHMSDVPRVEGASAEGVAKALNGVGTRSRKGGASPSDDSSSIASDDSQHHSGAHARGKARKAVEAAGKDALPAGLGPALQVTISSTRQLSGSFEEEMFSPSGSEKGRKDRKVQMNGANGKAEEPKAKVEARKKKTGAPVRYTTETLLKFKDRNMGPLQLEYGEYMKDYKGGDTAALQRGASGSLPPPGLVTGPAPGMTGPAPGMIPA